MAMKRITVFAVAFLWGVSLWAASSPLQAVRGFWDGFRLENADTFENSFDLQTFCTQALNQYWKGWDARQKAEFQKVFGKTFGKSLSELSKKEEFSHWKTEKMMVLKQEGPFAQIKVDHRSKGRRFPVELYLQESNGVWKVFGVSIDGADLTREYRSQFSRILQEEGYTGLIQRLQTKT